MNQAELVGRMSVPQSWAWQQRWPITPVRQPRAAAGPVRPLSPKRQSGCPAFQVCPRHLRAQPRQCPPVRIPPNDHGAPASCWMTRRKSP
ncbi:hypothetical protein OSJ10_15355 [Mycobacterium ulcerans]